MSACVSTYQGLAGVTPAFFHSARSAASTPEPSARLRNGDLCAATALRAASTSAVFAAPAGSSAGPTRRKPSCRTGTRKVPSPAAMKRRSAAGESTSRTSAAPDRPRASASRAVCGSTVTVQSLVLSNAGTREASSPASRSSVVVASTRAFAPPVRVTVSSPLPPPQPASRARAATARSAAGAGDRRGAG